jgi:stage III sporulation protein AB
LKKQKNFGGDRMIKTLGCLLILGASSVAGYVYGESYKKRVQQLNELERAINQLQSEIEYTYTPLPDALKNVSLKSRGPLGDIFKHAAHLLHSNEVETVFEAFSRCFKNVGTSLNLNKEDINIILDLSKTLGESDIDGHKKIFSLAVNNLRKRIKEAEILMGKNVKMYRYLGFSVGAMIVIVLL